MLIWSLSASVGSLSSWPASWIAIRSAFLEKLFTMCGGIQRILLKRWKQHSIILPGVGEVLMQMHFSTHLMEVTMTAFSRFLHLGILLRLQRQRLLCLF